MVMGSPATIDNSTAFRLPYGAAIGDALGMPFEGASPRVRSGAVGPVIIPSWRLPIDQWPATRPIHRRCLFQESLSKAWVESNVP